MFESVTGPSVAGRLRALLPVPVAAMLIAETYLSVMPMLGVPLRWPFHGVPGLLLPGSAYALVRGGMLLIRERSAIDWRALGYAALLVGVSALCLGRFLQLMAAW